MVKSFTGSEAEYSVAVDVEKSHILSCTCPDQTRHKLPCKHMYLVSRIYEDLNVRIRGGPMRANPDRTQETGGIDERFMPSPESVISSHLLQQLQAARAKDMEEKKRRREEATAQAFKECEKELMDLWKEVGGIVCDNGKRRCTLKDMETSVAELRSVVRNMKDRGVGM